jgi:hypothetical protein
LRSGKSTSTQGYNNQKHNTKADKKTRKEANVNENRAIQEPWEWYDKCDKRQRNKGTDNLVFRGCHVYEQRVLWLLDYNNK